MFISVQSQQLKASKLLGVRSRRLWNGKGAAHRNNAWKGNSLHGIQQLEAVLLQKVKQRNQQRRSVGLNWLRNACRVELVRLKEVGVELKTVHGEFRASRSWCRTLGFLE